MAAFDKAKELALKEYNVSTIDELRVTIVDIEFQKTMDKYIDEAKKRIVRKKQGDAKVYEPTDEEIVEWLQSKLDILNSPKE